MTYVCFSCTGNMSCLIGFVEPPSHYWMTVCSEKKMHLMEDHKVGPRQVKGLPRAHRTRRSRPAPGPRSWHSPLLCLHVGEALHRENWAFHTNRSQLGLCTQGQGTCLERCTLAESLLSQEREWFLCLSCSPVGGNSEILQVPYLKFLYI